jgi:hypothetical protein
VYTSTLLIALLGAAPSPETAQEPSWVTDYSEALECSAADEKPVAVILAPGKEGWRKIDREGRLTDEAKAVLAGQYICLHVNTATRKGRSLARKLEMPDGLGIVLSSRTGELQAFRHEGDLSSGKLVRYLRKYGDPDYVVRKTDTNPSKPRIRRVYVPRPPTSFLPSGGGGC